MSRVQKIEMVKSYLLRENATENEHFLATVCAEIICFAITMRLDNDREFIENYGLHDCKAQIEGAVKMFYKMTSCSQPIETLYIEYKAKSLIERILINRPKLRMKYYADFYKDYMKKLK